MNKAEGTTNPPLSIKSRWLMFLAVLGPGLVVMLADTDAGSVTTAAQSGALWGYKLLVWQVVLIPILFIVQELTVRLGLVTQRGHAELIKEHFGKFWAWISVGTMMVSCMGAIITEFSGIAGVGALFGVPVRLNLTLIVIFLTFIAWSGNYRSLERIAIAIGAFELVFIYVAWRSHPGVHEIWRGMTNIPITNSSYLYLLAANIGAVVMPWMIFYQQSAVIDKKIPLQYLNASRWDTAIGAVITQLIMAAILIATAATIGKTNPNASLNTVSQISDALTPSLGQDVGRFLFALGMFGAAMVATIVVSLAAAWALGEITGYRRSLEDKPSQAPWFYAVYTVALVFGAIVVASNEVNLVKINIAVEVMNALLLPIVLGFLFLLARKCLPEKYKLKGKYAWTVGIILFVTTAVGLFAGIWGIFN